MSNQSVNGFQGSQPFITDNEYKSLSLDQLRYILNKKKKTIKDNYKELGEKEKLIRDIRKLDKLNEKIKQGIDIKKKLKKHKTPRASKRLISNVLPGKLSMKIKKNKKIKTFSEYFKECIKNKQIPKDTPSYLRKALERAMREYDQGIEKKILSLEKEISSLDDFANKYVIEGIFGLTPKQFFQEINETLIDFFTNHINIKFRMVFICIMEKPIISKDFGITAIEQAKAYFSSETRYNLKSTDINELIKGIIDSFVYSIESYSANGSGWSFKEVEKLEIHTVEFNPTKGSSYILLPEWISNKKAIVNIKNKDEKCFLWCILRYLHIKKK